MKVSVYDKNGKKAEKTIDTKIFEGKENSTLLAEVVYILNSNKRQAGAKTLDRSGVSGGGRKPWRQKGTGRARVGSTRSPLWRSGGVTFGPTGEQNFKLSMPKKKRKAALMAALATKKAEDVLVLGDIKLEKPSTKEIAKMFEKLNLDRNILVVTDKKYENLSKSVKNLSYSVKVFDHSSLNAYEVLWAQKMLFIGDSLKLVSEGIK